MNLDKPFDKTNVQKDWLEIHARNMLLAMKRAGKLPNGAVYIHENRHYGFISHVSDLNKWIDPAFAGDKVPCWTFDELVEQFNKAVEEVARS